MLPWTRAALPLAVVVLGGCVPTPDEVSTTTTTGSGSTTTPGSTSTPGTNTDTREVDPDTTQGPPVETSTSDTTTSVGPTSDTGPMPECGGPGDCDSNQDCEMGSCVEACGGEWGMGSYRYCLDAYGAIDTNHICGAGHTCIHWGTPFEQTACSLQGCTTACDCPPPATTGNATVTCGEITDPPDMNDCYLDCSSGQTCPEGTTCTSNGVCAGNVLDVPLYGDCGNLASDCVPPAYCVDVPSGESVCTTSCANAGQCSGTVPSGGTSPVACTDVVPTEPGFECYLSCIGFTCPDGMTCINGTLCMWPD